MKTSWILPITFGTSLALHLSLLLGFHMMAVPQWVGETEPLSVTVEVVEEKSVVVTPSNKVVKKPTKRLVQKTKVASGKVSKKVDTVSSNRNSGVATLTSLYLNELKHLIRQQKSYPKSAQRLKQQGTVIVQFRVHRSGFIDQVKVSKDCPFKKLNAAALALVQQVGSFRPFPKGIRAQTLTVSIPVEYVLK